MKLIPTLTAVLLAGISLRAAESVQVEIAFSERKYVPGENVKAKIVIVNFSARPIHTGEDPRWLTLIVKSESGAEIIELMEELNSKGLTLVVVTHDPEIGSRARRQVRVVDGQIASDSLRGSGDAAP